MTTGSFDSCRVATFGIYLCGAVLGGVLLQNASSTEVWGAFFFCLVRMMLRGHVEALEFFVPFVNSLPPFFIFPTLRVCSAAEGFKFHRVDLFLNELS
jgi:hypothetical protein